MKILILGSGVLGITTAYVLGARGHEVEIIERKDCCAGETSFANGGQLSYSHAEPWANPHILKKLPKWLFHEESPLIFRLRADMDMVKWGLKFLRNCTSARAEENCINMLRLGLYSREKMNQIRAESNIQFDYGTKGILHIFGKQQDLDQAIKQSEFQAKFGCEEKVLSAAECKTLEPALNATSRDIIGGIHAHKDESGDAFLYCQELLKVAEQKYGVRINYGADIQGIYTEGSAITGISTSKGNFAADAYVMALGSYSPIHLKKIGIQLPIYPMKGYSITIPADEHCPHVSITDGTYKIVYSRLGSRMRVAGTAEFAGYNTEVRESRIAPIIKACKSLFPGAQWDSDQITKWACLRPSTPDGPPIMGSTPYDNLYLNTGHGTLGWTQGAGSAYIVADIIEKKRPEIMLNGLTLQEEIF